MALVNLAKKHEKDEKPDGGTTSNVPGKHEGNIIQRLFGFVADCVTPLMPALLCCGMLKVVLTLLSMFCGMSTTDSTYVLIYSFADAFFVFLPIFMGLTIAQRMGGNPMLFMVVGAALCYPELTALMGGENLGTFLGMPCTYLFGLPVICTTYTSSILPMLLMAPVMKWAEDFAERISPDVLKAFLQPLLFIIICIPCVLYVLGPLGNVIGSGLASLFTLMYNTVPWLTVGVLAAVMPVFVLAGIQYALVPIIMNNLATLGFDVIGLVTLFYANIAQGGASLGAAAKSKNTKVRSEGIACGISAIIGGVTEPALFGINLRFKTPMIGAVIAAGVGGLIAGIAGVKGYTVVGPPSIFALISFIGGDDPMHGFIFGTIAAVIVLALSFGITFVLFKDPHAGDPHDSGDVDKDEPPRAT